MSVHYGEGRQVAGKSGQMRTGGGGWLAKCGRPLRKKINSYHICLLAFNRECMECNVITSFQILSSFQCFLRYFQTELVFLPFSVNYSQVAMF